MIESARTEGGREMLELKPMTRRNLRRRNIDDLWDLRRWMDDFFDEPFEEGAQLMRSGFKIDVQDLDQSYRVEADLPGVQKEEIKLDYRDGVLTIYVNRSQESKEQEANYIRRERHLASMSRSLRLPDVKAGEIEARLEEGILHIDLPKSPDAEKRIEIEVK